MYRTAYPLVLRRRESISCRRNDPRHQGYAGQISSYKRPVEPAGFEPATFRVQGGRSSQLSYGPVGLMVGMR
jgi:hypothetical protein